MKLKIQQQHNANSSKFVHSNQKFNANEWIELFAMMK